MGKGEQDLSTRSQSMLDRVENKDVFKHRYAYSGILYCAEHNTLFHRSAGAKRRNRPIWACNRYLFKGLKSCASPIFAEKELDIVFKRILSQILDQKDVIINGLLERYKAVYNQNDYKTEIAIIKQKQAKIRQKKDKLLEFSIEGLIDNQEFHARNQELNAQMDALNNELDTINEDINKSKLLKTNMDYIRQEMLKETNFDDNIDDFIDLLIDRVYVSKIDNDRDRIKLDVILKFGNPLEIHANKGRHGDFDFSISENGYLSCINDGIHRY